MQKLLVHSPARKNSTQKAAQRRSETLFGLHAALVGRALYVANELSQVRAVRLRELLEERFEPDWPLAEEPQRPARRAAICLAVAERCVRAAAFA